MPLAQQRQGLRETHLVIEFKQNESRRRRCHIPKQ